MYMGWEYPRKKSLGLEHKMVELPLYTYMYFIIKVNSHKKAAV